MSKRDYYEVLGVGRDADQRELKRAYHRLALKHHPDRNPGDAEAEYKFKEAAEAYEVLNNSEKRALYDSFGHEGLSAGMGGPAGPGFSNIDDIFSQFGDIFGEFFGFGDRGPSGRAGARRGPVRGRNLRADLDLSFEEAMNGVERELEVKRRIVCEVCGGSGAAPGTTPETCPTCQGRGQIHHSQGFFTLTSTCPTCSGQGVVITSKCEACEGQGFVSQSRKVIVRVPAGVDDGMLLRLRGEGEPGSLGGPSGDLRVVLHVESSPLYEREGQDLHYRAEIPFWKAALGTTIEVPTLDGVEHVEVPPGTQFGQCTVLRDQGVPHVQATGCGNLFVHFQVTIPTELDDERRELLERFAELDACAVDDGEPLSELNGHSETLSNGVAHDDEALELDPSQLPADEVAEAQDSSSTPS